MTTAIKRPCLDCGDLTSGSRCPSCKRARDAARGSRQQRGYGQEHENARKMLGSRLPDLCGYYGRDPDCARGLIRPGDKWVAAHVVDGDPSKGWMVAHPACNERAKARR